MFSSLLVYFQMIQLLDMQQVLKILLNAVSHSIVYTKEDHLPSMPISHDSFWKGHEGLNSYNTMVNDTPKFLLGQLVLIPLHKSCILKTVTSANSLEFLSFHDDVKILRCMHACA